jgi:hypothetical protein
MTPPDESMPWSPKAIARAVEAHHWPPPTYWIRDMLEGIASAWEADRKERDELRRRVIERLEWNRELNAQIEALAKEIKVDDELLAERDRLLDAIPACEAHCNRCVPHAIEWVRAALAAGENHRDNHVVR